MGEEGFDTSPSGYTLTNHNSQMWLFDGTAGISFSSNSSLQHIDFASIHLYPQSWGLPNNAGNVWIDDHIRLAGTAGKPLVVGEFGVPGQQSTTYDSWLSTVLLDDGGGAMVWQLLEGARNNNNGFGIRCSGPGMICDVLRNEGALFTAKTTNGTLTPPQSFSLFQNYPTPFNGQTTIMYDLPARASVALTLYNSLGQRILTLLYGQQGAGRRKELLDAGSLTSGAYFYRVTAGEAAETKKLIVVR